MIYIVVLNWNGHKDTIACLESLCKLVDSKFKIVICDNASKDGSVEKIDAWYQERNSSITYLNDAEYVKLNNITSTTCQSNSQQKGLYLIQTGANLGFAGGNNIGIKFALNQPDMQYVWLLNNDTEVAPEALYHLVNRCESNAEIGVCGSRLVYHHDRSKIQALGGVFNSWLCTSKHYAAFEPSDKKFDDDDIKSEINYIVGASMLITRNVLERVGLLCEDYFLYYEEIDFSNRIIKHGYSLAVSSDSIVYHKEGASINRSEFSDYLFVMNRIKFIKKHLPWKLPCAYLSVLVAFLNRIRRFELKKALNILFYNRNKWRLTLWN